jgi:hypothetical protein
VEDLEALRRHLGLERFNLAGHSHGGFVALKYALAYPEHLDRLLVLNSGSFLGGLDPEWLQTRAGYGAAQARMAALDPTLGPDELQAEVIRNMVPVLHFYDYEPFRLIVEDLLGRTSFSGEPVQQFEREMAAFDIRDLVAGIQTRTLIVVGDDDLPVLFEGSMVLQERNSGFAPVRRTRVRALAMARAPRSVLPGGVALSQGRVGVDERAPGGGIRMKWLCAMGLSTFAVIVSCAAPDSDSAPRPDQVLVGVTVIDGTGAAPRPDQTIEITGGRISAVRPTAPGDRATLDAARVVRDARTDRFARASAGRTGAARGGPGQHVEPRHHFRERDGLLAASLTLPVGGPTRFTTRACTVLPIGRDRRT